MLYPDVCYMCWQDSQLPGDKLCFRCALDLPKTSDFEKRTNPTSNHFFGRVPVQHAASLFNYHRGSKIKAMLHHLKYQGKQEVGVYFGRMLGRRIARSPLYGLMDAITYVPLHPAKLRRRGYNQGRCIAEGVRAVLDLPIVEGIVAKTVDNESQTKKGRHGRLENVEMVFELVDATQCAGKRLLVVDDVITTGATLEACCLELVKGGTKELYLASLAVARF